MSFTHHTIKLNKSKMEGKSMLKLSHVLAFLLLASLFQSLMARDLISDGIEVLQFPEENDGEFVFCPGKQSWPELVGKSAGYAKVVIQKENPIVKDVRLLFPGMPMPRSYVCGRVFLVVNFKRIVRVTPSMG
ncbi:proteinase inhibitor I-B-like [Solanum pennellii]|uniref:Proteinase inhibitor I-B-like n=1 Tax=Solanum pennellii TaxID=28526 RepID=A0ABM1HLZ5_SOLPN|nr:proteinase inhibitor I-B-like [Solanum pennellii]